MQLAVDGARFGSPATLTGGMVTIPIGSLRAGSRAITAIYTSNNTNTYQSGQTAIPFTQLVGPAPLTVTANNQTKLYGAAPADARRQLLRIRQRRHFGQPNRAADALHHGHVRQPRFGQPL